MHFFPPQNQLTQNVKQWLVDTKHIAVIRFGDVSFIGPFPMRQTCPHSFVLIRETGAWAKYVSF